MSARSPALAVAVWAAVACAKPAPDVPDHAIAPEPPDTMQDAVVDAPSQPSPDAAAVEPPKSTLRFVVLADPQLGMTPTPDGSDLDMQYFALAVKKIGALQPPAAFALDCGDLVHNATLTSWQNYLATAGKMAIPHYEVMGNHDGWSASGLADFRKVLAKQDWYAFVDGDVLFVALNSYFLKQPAALPAETQAQKAFLAETLAKHASAKQKILFFHVPLYTKTPDEPENYWNLPPGERKYLIDVIESANITAVFTGHLHRVVILDHAGKLLLTSAPVAQPLGVNSDGTPAARGFFVVELDRTTGKLTYQLKPLLASEL